MLNAITHKRTNGSWGSVEDINFKLVNYLPEPIRSRIVWNAFKHNSSCAKTKRAIKDITMPGNPADISCTPINIFVIKIKYPLTGVHGIH